MMFDLVKLEEDIYKELEFILYNTIEGLYLKWARGEKC